MRLVLHTPSLYIEESAYWFILHGQGRFIYFYFFSAQKLCAGVIQLHLLFRNALMRLQTIREQLHVVASNW